jgi:CRP/FNR family transcriptional regulator
VTSIVSPSCSKTTVLPRPARRAALVGHVHPGDFLGEISLVAQKPHNATAVAATDIKLIALKHNDFETLISRYPRIGVKVMRNIAVSLGQKLDALDARFTKHSLNQKA